MAVTWLPTAEICLLVRNHLGLGRQYDSWEKDLYLCLIMSISKCVHTCAVKNPYFFYQPTREKNLKNNIYVYVRITGKKKKAYSWAPPKTY